MYAVHVGKQPTIFCLGKNGRRHKKISMKILKPQVANAAWVFGECGRVVSKGPLEMASVRALFEVGIIIWALKHRNCTNDELLCMKMLINSASKTLVADSVYVVRRWAHARDFINSFVYYSQPLSLPYTFCMSENNVLWWLQLSFRKVVVRFSFK